jgi:tRNA(Ile)-lysidine synthase
MLRSWENGDSFRPLGMQGTKKISDLLIDRKIDRFTKMNQLVLTANGAIIWVCGLQISDDVKITDKTKQFVELSINPGVG